MLSVVIFHAFPSWMKGGFTGVDVFFVISGYLISTIIFENLDKGTFTFSGFYARRIKRIFPALLLVLAASYAYGWFGLLADEYKQLGKHIAAGSVFVSNFVLWSEAGYFDSSAETKPLLHLWSLGIEEQFYIFWPLLLWFAWKKRFNFLLITVSVAFISYILNIRGIQGDSVATFYSPQTRFWELLAGSVLAWINLYKKGRSQILTPGSGAATPAACLPGNRDATAKILSNIASLTGLLLLLGGFWAISKDAGFPGKWALVPVTGAVLLIGAGPEAWMNRHLLSNKVAVWFGLISFPLYLWHWPLLSFARILEGELPSRNMRVAAVMLSVALAWLTYRFIERPVRFGKNGKFRVAVLVLLMAGAGLTGYVTYFKDGLAFRENASLKAEYAGDIGHTEFFQHIFKKHFPCPRGPIADEAERWEGFVRCAQSKSSPDVEVALVGDSHAEHLFLGVADAFSDKNVAYYIKGHAPFVGGNHFNNIFEFLENSKSVKKVILTMYWSSRIREVPTDSTLENELIQVVDRLSRAGKNVYLVHDVPKFPFDPKACKGARWPLSGTRACQMSPESYKSQTAKYSAALERIAEMRPEIKILDVEKYFCNEASCSMVKGNALLYRDTNHLNVNGSLYLGKKLIEDNFDIFRP